MPVFRLLMVLLISLLSVACSGTGSAPDAPIRQPSDAQALVPEHDWLLNGSFDDPEDAKKGWEKGVHANPDSYRFEVLMDGECLSSPCIAIIQQGTEPWGGLFQWVDLPDARPTVLQFRANLRGIDSNEPTHLQALVKRPGKPDDIHELKVDLLPIFAPATLEIPLPDDARAVELAVVHHGAGAVVVDDVTLSGSAR